MRGDAGDDRLARDLAIGVLAVWRVTHLISNEDGPLEVMARLRTGVKGSLLGELMGCFNCLSMWVAAGATPFVSRRRSDLPLVWLALSGAACLLERFGNPSDPVLDLSTLGRGDHDGLLPAESAREDG